MSNESSALQREIQQTKPFRSIGQEAVLGIVRTADVVRRFLARVLEPYDVTPQQYNVLRILRGAGADGLPTLTIGERMLEDSPGVTRLIDRLVQKELVTRARSKEDRRQVLCRITPAGLDLLARMDGPVNAHDGATLYMLTEDEQKVLIRLLDRIRAGHVRTDDSTQTTL
ncbi:MAG TPA: MarR family transcriptional regulator [Acidobacteria bacterium]|nr:MarR family transcriptional regulator [Acidobacteriota bacterium]